MKTLRACIYLSAWWLCTIAASSPVLADVNPVPLVDGRINVRDSEFKPVFIRDQRFYPGETITFRADSKVDAMRWMHEERQCWSEWFGGMFCKRVNRSDSSGLNEQQVPLVLDLRSDEGPIQAGLVAPARLAGGTPYDPAGQLPIGINTFTLTLNPADVEAQFGRGYALYGHVAPNYGKPPSVNQLERKPCAPFRDRAYCSQGEYVLTLLSVDSTSRLKMLKRYLAEKQRSFDDLFIDDWLIYTIAANGSMVPNQPRRDEIAQMLLEHVEKFYPASPGHPPLPDRLPILQMAQDLNRNNSSVGTAIVATQIASGNLGAAEAQNQATLDKYRKQYQQGSRTEETLRGYAGALYNAGDIQLAKHAEFDQGDARMAVDFYRMAGDIWAQHALQSGADIGRSTNGYVAARVAQATTGARISDVIPFDDSIAALRDARRKLPLERGGLITSVSAASSAVLIADDQFASLNTPVAKAAAPLDMRLGFGFLPASTREIVDADPPLGRILVRRRIGTRLEDMIVDIGGGSANRTMILGKSLVNPVLTTDGVVGYDGQERTLVRMTADTSSQIAPVPDGSAWAVARGTDTLVVGPSAAGSSFALIKGAAKTNFTITELDQVDQITLSRDGQWAAITGLKDGSRRLALARLDPSPSIKRVFTLTSQTSLTASFFAEDNATLIYAQDPGTLSIIDASVSVPIKVQLPPGSLMPVALWDDLVLLPASANSSITTVVAVQAQKALKGADGVAPLEASTTIDLDTSVPATGIVPVVKSRASKQVTLLGESLGSSISRMTVNGLSYDGVDGAKFTVAEWHPERSFLISDKLAINPARGGPARLIDANDERHDVVTPAGGSTQLIPLAKKGTVAVLTRGADGGLSKAELFASPDCVPVSDKKPGSGCILERVEFPDTDGRSWELLSLPVGPLTQEVQQLAFVLRPTIEQAESVSVKFVTVDATGQALSSTRDVRNPRQIVGLVGLPKQPIIRRTEGAIQIERPDATTLELGSCESGTACTLQAYQPADGSVLVSRQTESTLEIRRWSSDEPGVVQNCAQCARFDAKAARTVAEQRPVGVPFAPFSLTSSPTDLYVAIPSTGFTVAGSLISPAWALRGAVGMPALSGPDSLLVQADRKVQIWHADKR